MYTETDFKTKKQFKVAVSQGHKIRLYARCAHSGMGAPKSNGTEFVEGPHYPKPHTWYAKVEMRDGIVVKVE